MYIDYTSLKKSLIGPVFCSIRLIVDFEAEIKMTGSARAKNRKKGLHCIGFLKIECMLFYPVILVNTKTIFPLRVSASSGLVASDRYVPRRLASRYISAVVNSRSQLIFS